MKWYSNKERKKESVCVCVCVCVRVYVCVCVTQLLASTSRIVLSEVISRSTKSNLVSLLKFAKTYVSFFLSLLLYRVIH